MNRTIWKFAFDGSKLEIELSGSHKVVLVDLDPITAVPTIWIEHYPDAEVKTKRRFELVGTGEPIPVGAEHVGSTLQGPFVWHVYRWLH